MKQNKMIAVCGGIASGKSVVMSIIENLGGKTLYCDRINAKLLTDKSYINEIAKAYPDIIKDGEIDKSRMKKLIISNDKAKNYIQSIAHPIIIDRIVEQANKIGGLVFVEVPLIVGSNTDKIFSELWFIKSSYQLRINQLALRDNITIDDARTFIDLQSAEDSAESIAHRIIINEGTYTQLCETIKKLYLESLQ